MGLHARRRIQRLKISGEDLQKSQNCQVETKGGESNECEPKSSTGGRSANNRYTANGSNGLMGMQPPIIIGNEQLPKYFKGPIKVKRPSNLQVKNKPTISGRSSNHDNSRDRMNIQDFETPGEELSQIINSTSQDTPQNRTIIRQSRKRSSVTNCSDKDGVYTSQQSSGNEINLRTERSNMTNQTNLSINNSMNQHRGTVDPSVILSLKLQRFQNSRLQTGNGNFKGSTDNCQTANNNGQAHNHPTMCSTGDKPRYSNNTK
jgi:hypothetical protein